MGTLEEGKDFDALIVDVNVPGGPFDVFDGEEADQLLWARQLSCVVAAPSCLQALTASRLCDQVKRLRTSLRSSSTSEMTAT